MWLFLAFFPAEGSGQRIAVTVTAAESGQTLYLAHALNVRTGQGNLSDEEGRIRLSAVPGDSVMVSYVGYQDTIFLTETGRTNYEVALSLRPMETVVIFAEESFNRKAAEGRQDVAMEFLEALPAFNGDPDIMKAVTFLPGVNAGKEGYSHLSVRGGGIDENLILLDGAPLYNVNHFGGFVSMFHSDMIRGVDFYKGYWPSSVGGRLSSVMDVHTASGNYKDRVFSADISPLSTKAHLSGPLWKDKVSYMIGGRRTFLDLLAFRFMATKPIREGKKEGFAPLMTTYDLNGKIEARISDHQVLSFSAFRGSDNFYHFRNEYGRRERDHYHILNGVYTLNYSHYLTSGTSLKAHLSTSGYEHFMEDELSDTKTRYDLAGNSIRTHKIQVYGNTEFAGRGSVSYGMDYENTGYEIYMDRYRKITATDVLTDSLSLRTGLQRTHVTSFFADGLYRFNDRFRLKAGIRLPRYARKTYSVLTAEPRLLMSYDLTGNTTMNVSYNRQSQFSHLMGFTQDNGYFREFYTASEKEMPPSRSHQWSTGLFHHFSDRDGWLHSANFSVEGFYKIRRELNLFRTITDPNRSIVEYQDHMVHDGQGYTYGLEFLFQKTTGKLHTSLSYAYSRSRIRFDGVNSGKAFDSDFDARHSINALVIYKFRKGYQMSAQWNYYSGRPFTLPVSQSGEDIVVGAGYPLITEVNNARMPAYHRLDLSLDREWRTRRKGIKNWFGVSIYNAYDRVNPFFASPGYEEGTLEVSGFFPLLPSFHFGFELGGKKNKNDDIYRK